MSVSFPLKNTHETHWNYGKHWVNEDYNLNDLLHNLSIWNKTSHYLPLTLSEFGKLLVMGVFTVKWQNLVYWNLLVDLQTTHWWVLFLMFYFKN